MLYRYLICFVCVLSFNLIAWENRSEDKTKKLNNNITRRSAYNNCRIRFTEIKKGNVAFIGGSITEMNGYRPMVCEFLETSFPDTEFNFIDAGISSTCSTTGAFRLQQDILDKCRVDLLFIEFAVNDNQDAGHALVECVRGMEGIVRHARIHNPAIDIVITYFVNPDIMKQISAGKCPVQIKGHETVAEYYKVSTINLAEQVTEDISRKKYDWKKFGGVHPAPFGNRICADMIKDLLKSAWKNNAAHKTLPCLLPPEPLDIKSYFNGAFLDSEKAELKKGWQILKPDWKSLKGQCRGRFRNVRMLVSDNPGDKLSLEFSGTALGVYVLAGPDAGTLEVSIDNKPFKKVDLYHRYSSGLHYPRTCMFSSDLENTEHTAVLKVSKEKNSKSTGTAVRIIKFTVN